MMIQRFKKFGWSSALLGFVFSTLVLSPPSIAQYQDQGQDQQDQRDDPPSRVARIGYLEGSVSFQPAGEPDWVQAVPNRPMTTGDRLWSDRDSRAELQLGSAVIRLDANTGFSFLNLDDNTVQIQLTSGSVNVRVRRLDQNDVFEIDTPNLAFSISQPGNYRVAASEDGTNTIVSVREGGGQSTGNGQTYTLHAGQSGTFSGTDSLNADVVDIRGPDRFDDWAYQRDHSYEQSRSAQYVSHDVVGYEDLDHYGDWRDDSNYGHVWYPNQVAAGWAPYHDGHWEWIAPWGYTWVDDSPWGYAPFHYGRWVTVGGRWGWVAGPVAVRPVYAPALVVFIGGGGGFAGNVGWFPLGPREVYVPSYHVSRGYVNRVNVSNTTVNTTTVTNVYNTTIINNRTTNITNVTYANRNVRGAVTAVPQRSFATAQPVAHAAVRVDARQIAAAPVSARVAVAPTRESVLGVRAATANRVTTPPQAVMNRQVIAKATPPPPPVPFARQQQALAAHPGQPLARREVQNLRPTAAAEAHPMVKQAPPGKPATPTMGRPNPAANQPNAAKPGTPASVPPASEPANRPGNQPGPNERPGAANPTPPNRPASAQPNPSAPAQPNNRPEPNRPTAPAAANDRSPATQPNGRPEVNQPNNRPAENRPPAAQPNTPTPNDRPGPNRPPTVQPDSRPAPTTQPDNRPEANQPNNRPAENRPPAAQPNPAPNNGPGPNRPPAVQPDSRPSPTTQPDNRPEANQPNKRPEPARPPAAQPAQPGPDNRPDTNRPPAASSDNRTNQRDRQPDATPRPNRPPSAQPSQPSPNNSPGMNQPPSGSPNRPSNRPPADRPERAQPNASQPAPETGTSGPGNRPQRPPAQAAPVPRSPQPTQAKPLTPEEKKRQDEQRKREQEQKPPGE